MHAYLPVALAFVSALLFYLGSPGQQWRSSPLRPGVRRCGILATIGALFAGADGGHLAATLSVVVTTQMACFVAFPFFGVLCERARAARAPQ